MLDWTTEFYREPNGHSPVEEFLDSLDEKARARFRWAFEQLRLRNVHAQEPLVRHLEDKLWEIRVESRASAYRVIYFFFAGKRIVFVHGFQKKTPKTPKRELEIARKRALEFLSREGR